MTIRLKRLSDPVALLVRGSGYERRAVWTYAATEPTLPEYLAFCRQFKNVRWTKGGTSNWDLDEMQAHGAIELVEENTFQLAAV
jgi:hypothetical protein